MSQMEILKQGPLTSTRHGSLADELEILPLAQREMKRREKSENKIPDSMPPN